MEWTRIEAKWHDMARRLQQGHPTLHDQTGTTADAMKRPARKTVADHGVRVADDAVVVQAAEI